MIYIIETDPDIPEIVATLRNMLVYAREQKPNELEKLLLAEQDDILQIPSLADWANMNLMEFGLMHPFSIRHYYLRVKNFVEKIK